MLSKLTLLSLQCSYTGYLYNTEVLRREIRHNYILEVNAEDCGGRQSDNIMVSIVVKEAETPATDPPQQAMCQTGWSGRKEIGIKHIKEISYNLT